MIGGVSDDDLRGRFAVVVTHNRPALLADCVRAVAPQVDLVVVIDNASEPPATAPPGVGNVVIGRDLEQPPNLSRLWNRGFDVLATTRPAGMDQWDVAVLCDDTAPPPGWFTAVATTMRAVGAVAGSTHQYQPVCTPLVKTAMDSDLHNRMCGWAFLVAGEAGLRADESLRWWWCDTDLDVQARLRGGMVIAPGPTVVNGLPNDFTHTVPGLAEQAGRDRATFAGKWGYCPW